MKTSKLLIGSIFVLSASLSQAATVVSNTIADTNILTHQIFATDNLYYVSWGHWYTQHGDGENDALLGVPNLDGALNDGTPARAVAGGNNQAYAFDRNLLSSITISVTGSVMDAGINYTDPNGYADEPFRMHPSYSVIGLWSTSAILADNTVVKFDSAGNAYAPGQAGYEDITATQGAPFFIGTGRSFDFSQIFPDSIQTLYLFLANNDGDFSDNIPTQFYNVTIALTEIPQVPVPAAGLLLGSALVGLSAIARRRRTV